jgi:hypothetical protein
MARMRLQTTLLQIAVLLAAGCGGSTTNGNGTPDASGTDGSGGKDAQGTDSAKDGPSAEAGEAGVPAEAACGGCNCGQPNTPQGDATPEQACALAASFQGVSSGNSAACESFCASINDGGSGQYYCQLPSNYVTAYDTAVGDAGQKGGADSGADAGLQCPAWTGSVVVQCSTICLGRRTEGVADPSSCDESRLGDVFSARAYLEEVSVHAFARLERELVAHGAPARLLREARRARRDEVRHTAMTAKLARRFGGTPRSPEPPAPTPVRSLVAIAIENAVEGCVRETYGAVAGLVEARLSSDAGVRRAMESIAADECRHAELAWAIAAWAMPRLTAAERAMVERAKREAVAKLAREGDARTVAMLDEEVWAKAA